MASGRKGASPLVTGLLEGGPDVVPASATAVGTVVALESSVSYVHDGVGR